MARKSDGYEDGHHCLFAWPNVKHLVICGWSLCTALPHSTLNMLQSANSLSKTGSATGWRVGWTLAVDRITQRIRSVHDTLVMQAPTPLQRGLVQLLKAPSDFFDALRRCYQEKRDFMCKELRSLGFQLSIPQGSYYLFVRYGNINSIRRFLPREAAEYLVRSVGVAVVPGDNFYSENCAAKNNYLRVAFCKQNGQLRESISRLQAGLSLADGR
eukprot:GHVS01032201.1.p1 GENE.GHVS01032201.1~~GHVS01032201.1.p1  ORF type:complete len:214 (+),score=10.39 GHVS01032201.1:844-1485(+)